MSSSGMPARALACSRRGGGAGAATNACLGSRARDLPTSTPEMLKSSRQSAFVHLAKPALMCVAQAVHCQREVGAPSPAFSWPVVMVGDGAPPDRRRTDGSDSHAEASALRRGIDEARAASFVGDQDRGGHST